ncbi:MAG: cytochrome c3 family protein [Magnetococcus sp. DMHC-6]
MWISSHLVIIYRMIVPVALAILIGVVFNSSATKKGHLLDADCTDCHLAEKVDGKNSSMLLASQEKLCSTCHPDAIRLSHPSGFSPRHELPKEFPLDWKGDMTCSSCHLIHANTPGLMRSQTKGLPFCLSCHTETFFDQMPDRGASMVNSGHLDARSETTEEKWDNLDSFSLQCVGCHDDDTAAIKIKMSAGLVKHEEGAGSHPIGVEYEKATSFGGYRPLNQIPTEVVLPDGKVGCISCHQGYSEKHGALVRSNDDSGLCMTCHDL